ncbi:hypothetical protein [Sphingomonas sp. Leaf21]|uniref:hypothetical protein n=1 Tax=Sphingomonas sp. Leaf21 TaxID=2876550 RepID=UPI001E407182|nr:hypothetical protein [Sphingomonas sp. Leaf21]
MRTDYVVPLLLIHIYMLVGQRLNYDERRSFSVIVDMDKYPRRVIWKMTNLGAAKAGPPGHHLALVAHREFEEAEFHVQQSSARLTA